MASPQSSTSPISLDFGPLEWFLEVPGKSLNWRAEATRLLPYAAGYALLHGVMVAAGYVLSTVPETAVAIWPAVGLLAAMLAATPQRTWPLWIAASLLGRIATELLMFDARQFIAPVLFGSVNVVEALVFATFIQRPLLQAFRQGRPLYLSVAFAIVGFASAAVGGLLGATALQTLDYQPILFWQALRLWAAGDFLGMVLVTPLAIWLLLPQIRIRRRLARWPECLAMPPALLLTLAVAVWLAPAEDSMYRDAIEVGLASLMTIPVLWAAIRAEFPVVAGLQILLAVTVVFASMNGLGPFAHDVESYLPMLAAMQIFLLTMVLIVTIVSFAILERQRAQQEASLHQRFTDLLVQLTGKLMAAGGSTLDAVIRDSLRLIGEFAGADRCSLMQVARDGLTITRTHVWSADGADSPPSPLTGLDLRDFPWIVERFRERGFLVLNDVESDLPRTDEVRRIIREVPDIRAAVYVGLFTSNQLIGAIGYGFRETGVTWSNESISLMYLVGQLFANILKRKYAESDLRTYQQKLRSLATDLAVAEERMRRRTANDLHDGIGQNLAVARMRLGKLLAGDTAMSDELSQVRELIDEALRGTRFIIADLSPTILYELGLLPALQALAERFEPANDLTCRVTESGDPWEPGNDLRIALYRGVQECLNNVARHARAQTVRITVSWTSEDVRIDVADDGVGFDSKVYADQLPEVSGYGLFSLSESLSLLGGTLDIETARGIGTTISMQAPRREAEDGE